MNNLYVDEELIKGYVIDIKTYMIRELKKYITISEDEIDFSITLVNDVNEVLQVIKDLKNNEFVVLKYHPMGSWYLEEGEDNNE